LPNAGEPSRVDHRAVTCGLGIPLFANREVLVSASREKHTVFVGEYDAWLLDLDGVITDTASVHAAAWKGTFDGHLEEVSKRGGARFVPFEVDPDYYEYVDGRPRYDGVDAFLRSRGIVLPWGKPDDPLAQRRSVASVTARTEPSRRYSWFEASRCSNRRLP
jgi:hypothetical protein